MMVNDKKIKISVGSSRKSTQWFSQELYWSEFIHKVKTPTKTSETFAEYKAFPKAKQDDLKDVGGYVAGELKDNRRKNENVQNRYLVTLDADNIQAGQTQDIINRVNGLGCAYVIYSTRKHESYRPRLRIVFPLDTPCSADEYEPIARKVASFIGMDIFDPTTFEPVRLMFWPSISSDGEYVFDYADKPFLSKDGMLGLYQNWRNIVEWPEVPGATKAREKSAKKQGNPLDKKGVVGAFCKVYDIEKAIATFLPDVYEPCELGQDRYTFAEGSTVGGAVLYEDGNFLYSHHATDPAGGKLCNAFDLVRLHKFSEEDEQAPIGTPTVSLPSYKKMCQFAIEDEQVAKTYNKERFEVVKDEFGENIDTEEGWSSLLQINPQTGACVKTIDNVLVILSHDPYLKERFYHDDFANRATVCLPMPWEHNTEYPYKERAWTDEDDAGLRHYMEKHYNITGEKKIYDAMAIYATSHRVNKIKDYLRDLVWDGTPRLDTLLIDYFGAEDNEYTRLAMRKTLVAAVARVMNPGVKWDTMLILAGGQGIGKSTFFRKLGKDWFSDSLTSFEGKEAAELLQGYWIIEAGELTGLNKSEMNAVKQFLSKEKDIYRMPYGRRTGEFPRSCIIVGTTNEMEFLKDKTGNRRFWPIDLGKQETKKNVFYQLDLELDQIWAEAFVRWQCGEKLYLEGVAAEEAKRQQDGHKEADVKEGLIAAFLEKEIPEGWEKKDAYERRQYWNYEYKQADNAKTYKRDRICAAEIWNECFGCDLVRMRQSDTRLINSILRNIEGWEEQNTRFGIYGRQRGFLKTDGTKGTL